MLAYDKNFYPNYYPNLVSIIDWSKSFLELGGFIMWRVGLSLRLF